MAICKLNRNLTKTTSCGYSLPEIVDIYLINYEDLSGKPEVSSVTETGCEAITATSISSSGSVYHVEPSKNSASFEDTLVVEDNGSKYRNASITFNVSGRYDECMHGSLDALALGRYFVVVKTADNNYLGFGRISPLEAETATLAGGSDNNGMQIVLAGNIAESPLPLSDGAVAELLSKVAA
ncbi:MAG: hypothetical protein J6T10_19190 [Methanobrevibacter sp.]|nr:hypothetical protein [Methanobrevibacter sp.]